jgi:hypothetical protein
MIHKWMRNYDINGVWTKSQRKINVDGVEHDLDEYAKQHGIDLPDSKKSKKQINTDIEEKHEDMEQSLDSGDIEINGDGDSESTE